MKEIQSPGAPCRAGKTKQRAGEPTRDCLQAENAGTGCFLVGRRAGPQDPGTASNRPHLALSAMSHRVIDVPALSRSSNPIANVSPGRGWQ